MKRILILILLVFSIQLHAEGTGCSTFTINGVSDPLLSNVEKRLQEIKLIRPLKELNQEELGAQVHEAIQPFAHFKARIDIRIESKNCIITIYPGPQLLVSSLKIQLIGAGDQEAGLIQLINNWPLKPQNPLLIDDYNKAKLNMINTAENLGYLRAHFKKSEILLDIKNNSAQLDLIFDTGPLFYFGQVQFDPTYISPKLLHRFVPFHPGKPYSTDEILKFNNDLSSSGYFKSVVVKPQITDAQSVPVQVHLQPVSRYSYSLGAGYGTDTGIRGRAGLHITPVNRLGHKFNAVAQGSMSQNVVQAQYIVPANNPVTDQYSLTGNFSNLNYTSGTSNSVLVSLAEQHNLDWYRRTLSINALYDRFKYTFEPNSDQFLLYPRASITLSSAKNKLFSPSGFTFTLTGLAAAKAALSSNNLGQLSADARAALMIEPLRLRLYGHALQGLTATNNINQLPLSMALLLGGTDNLKGYSFNSIGPGRMLSYGGFELQKEIMKHWYLLGFYDAGTVYNPDPKITHYDAGGGLMWVSPIGQIKAGIAQPINGGFGRIGGSSPRLVISMGTDL